MSVGSLPNHTDTCNSSVLYSIRVFRLLEIFTCEKRKPKQTCEEHWKEVDRYVHVQFVNIPCLLCNIRHYILKWVKNITMKLYPAIWVCSKNVPATFFKNPISRRQRTLYIFIPSFLYQFALWDVFFLHDNTFSEIVFHRT